MGRLAYQTTGSGPLLARYTYDLSGAPVSVQVGSDPTTAPRYYYVYDARGDVVNLTDASGASVASYVYDTWGALTASSETIPNAGGWVNPYRFDGRDRARYDASDGLYWLSTRAYDATTGRFLARDPLGRVPLFFADNPYAYAGNNPLSNVDPSGQYRAAGHGSAARESSAATNAMMARVVAQHGTQGKSSGSAGCGGCKQVQPMVSPLPPCAGGVFGNCDFAGHGLPTDPSMARDDAGRLAAHFGLVSAAFLVLAFLLTGIDVTQPWLSFLLGAAIVTSGQMAMEAGAVAALFWSEAEEPLSWYTLPALQTFANVVMATIATISLASILFGGWLQKAVIKVVGYVLGGVVSFASLSALALNGIAKEANDLYS